jgi:hypothetical protein
MNQQQPPGVPPASTARSGVDRAALSMYLGLSSLVLFCLTGVPAIALGVMSLPHTDDAGKKRAFVGIAAGGFTTLVSIAMLLVLLIAPSAEQRKKLAASATSAEKVESDSNDPIGKTFDLGKCRFTVVDVITQHGDASYGGYNWSIGANVKVQTTHDVKTQCGAEVTIMTPSGELIEADLDTADAEVGYGYTLDPITQSESMVPDAVFFLTLRSEPGVLGIDKERKPFRISKSTTAKSHDELIELTHRPKRE